MVARTCSTYLAFVLVMAHVFSACGDSTAPLDVSDIADDISDEVADPITCGPDDPTTGNLSWASEVTPDCTHYLSSVHLPDAGEADAFAVLANLREVRGSLTIFRPHVEVNLDLLSQLVIVEGEFSYRMDDAQRRSLLGPPRLREVGELRIENNRLLEDLQNFAPQLQTVRGDLTIRDNRRLSPSEVTRFVDRLTVLGEVRIEANGEDL